MCLIRFVPSSGPNTVHTGERNVAVDRAATTAKTATYMCKALLCLGCTPQQEATCNMTFDKRERSSSSSGRATSLVRTANHAPRRCVAQHRSERCLKVPVRPTATYSTYRESCQWISIVTWSVTLNQCSLETKYLETCSRITVPSKVVAKERTCGSRTGWNIYRCVYASLHSQHHLVEIVMYGGIDRCVVCPKPYLFFQYRLHTPPTLLVNNLGQPPYILHA